MFRLLAVISFFGIIQGASIPAHSGKIIGGEITTIENVPWQVALEENGEIFCGGSIISANYILTGASCTRGLIPLHVKVRAGSSKIHTNGTVIGVDRIYINEGYDNIYRDFDVSILLLLRPLPLGDTIQPIRLRRTPAAAGEPGQVSGWGSTNYTVNTISNDLRAVKVPIINYLECNEYYSHELTDRMICAGQTGKDWCRNDDGGALTINNIQVGIASWSYACALEGYPGVYTKVSAVYDYINTYSNNEATWI